MSYLFSLSANLGGGFKYFLFSPRTLGKSSKLTTLQGTNISFKNGILKMIFPFQRWDMLVPWRVIFSNGLVQPPTSNGEKWWYSLGIAFVDIIRPFPSFPTPPGVWISLQVIDIANLVGLDVLFLVIFLRIFPW